MLNPSHVLLLPLLVLQSGDRVVYSKYAGTDVQVAGEEHVLLKVGPCMHPSSSAA
jgi:co-chaperonin GroES (HSP10)